MEKAATYPLNKYASYYRKWNMLNIIISVFGFIGLIITPILGALIDLKILFCLLLFLPLLICGIIATCFTSMCLKGASECKKIIGQIKKDIVFVKDISFYDLDNQDYLLHILKELIRNNNLDSHLLFKNLFLYHKNIELEEKDLIIDKQLVKFELVNNKIIIKKCPNCNHPLIYGKSDCEYCG